MIRGRYELVPGQQTEKEIWSPKNKGIPRDIRGEDDLDEKFWKTSGFPKHRIPAKVETHVRKSIWTWLGQKMVLNTKKKRQIKLLEDVQKQLEQGVNSGVGEPGTRITRTRNSFQAPETDVIKICLMVTSEERACSRAV